jgi:hypothetical protein
MVRGQFYAPYATGSHVTSVQRAVSPESLRLLRTTLVDERGWIPACVFAFFEFLTVYLVFAVLSTRIAASISRFVVAVAFTLLATIAVSAAMWPLLMRVAVGQH